HSIMAFELSARGRGINCQRRQLLVRQPTTRRTLDFSAQTLNQFRWTFARFGRMTPQTRTIPALNRFYRGSKKIDILSRRLFRRAGGPAKNSRRAHSDKNMPSKLASRFTSARYIVSGGGRSSGVVM